MGRQRIIVVDTLTTSVGLGLIVEAAARAAAAGAPQAEVVRIVRGMIPTCTRSLLRRSSIWKPGADSGRHRRFWAPCWG